MPTSFYVLLSIQAVAAGAYWLHTRRQAELDFRRFWLCFAGLIGTTGVLFVFWVLPQIDPATTPSEQWSFAIKMAAFGVLFPGFCRVVLTLDRRRAEHR